jgi:asparagine N-glycosylation enzyme membrane subunit Stt3
MENEIKSIQEKNRFKEMGFIKFWFFSTLFFLTFPISLVFCLLFFGFKETKQFITVLIKDYVQTIFVIFILSLSMLIFFIYYLVSLFN